MDYAHYGPHSVMAVSGNAKRQFGHIKCDVKRSNLAAPTHYLAHTRVAFPKLTLFGGG
jgi:hypothetical protein